MTRILVLATALLLSSLVAAAPPGDGPTAAQPDWQFVSLHAFEKEHPGMGVSRRYRARGGWLDVYEYGLQRTDWQPGVNDPQFGPHFESTVEEVRHYGRAGLYAQLEIGAWRDVQVAGQTFRTIPFSFLREGRPMRSVTYLTARNGGLLKYRLSVEASSGIDLDAAVRQFIAQPLPPAPSAPSPRP
jgi:hypothetical protein